ncbi:hypothetical protein ACWDRR_14910 [Kitasatospora sp. NPDC003701]
MHPRLHQTVVALAVTVAATGVLSGASYIYDFGADAEPETAPRVTSAPESPPWPAPDAATLARLIAALGEIYPELRDGSPGMSAQKICTDIRRGADEKSLLRSTGQAFAGDGSYFLDDGQVVRILAAVRENVCPTAGA